MPADLNLLRVAAADAAFTWTPGETVNTGLSDLAARSRLGARPPGGEAALLQRQDAAAARLSAAGDHLQAASAPKLPTRFDWRKAPAGNYVSAVRDQAGCGSCVAFGVVGVLESMVRITAAEPSLDVDLSEAFVYFCLGPDAGAGACPDGGWWPHEALSAMKARGVSDEANYPYTDADQPCRRGSDYQTRLTRFTGFTRKTSTASMKKHLTTVGPMVACFTVYEDFFYYYTGGVWRYRRSTAGEIVGGHCVMIVGYDDTSKCWIAKNSWGAGWGEKGYFRIGYGSAGIDAEMWGITGVSSPLIRTTLQVAGAGQGQVWHTLRSGKPAWQQAPDRLDAGRPGDPGDFTTVTAAASINRVHVLGLVAGKPWYTRQRTGAGWAVWAAPGSPTPAGVNGWTDLSVAAVGDVLHLVGLAGGGLWHTSRGADGSWSNAWQRVSPATGGPAPFQGVSCVAVGTRPTVIGLAAGVAWLCSRNTDGSWTQLKRVAAASPAPTGLSALSTACVGGGLELVALSSGRPWHVRRDPAKTWGAWRELTSTASAPAAFDAIACADVGTALHVIALAGGVPWYTSRDAQGRWRASFADLSGKFSAAPALARIDLA